MVARAADPCRVASSRTRDVEVDRFPEWGHGVARLTFRRHPVAEPIFLGEIRLGERFPNLFRRGADKGDIDKLRLTHHVPPVLFSCRSASAGVNVRTFRSNVRRSRGTESNLTSSVVKCR